MRASFRAVCRRRSQRQRPNASISPFLSRATPQACEVRLRGLPVLIPYVALPAIDVQAFPRAVLATGESRTQKTPLESRVSGASCRRQNTQYGEMMPSAVREVKQPLSSCKSPHQSGSKLERRCHSRHQNKAAQTAPSPFPMPPKEARSRIPLSSRRGTLRA